MKHKRILAAVMCLCISAATTVCSLPEQTLPVSALTLAEPTASIYDIYMYKNHGDYIEITACSTTATGDIVVPTEIDGLPVTVVGEHGFAGTHLTTIQLPDTVHTIGKQAFAMCAELREVNIPDGVTEIGDEAFLNCTSLTSIVTTTLPDSLTSIGVRAFRGCTSLTAVTLPNHLTSLGEMAFGSCTALEFIRIPDGITELQTNTLYQCNKLKTLTLPESVVSVGSVALPDSLERLTVLNKDCVIDTSNVYFAAERNWVIAAPAGGEVQAFAEQFGYTFAEIEVSVMQGDVSGDGELNVLDIVMMQKWLLGVGEMTVAQAADINDDGEVDIFDLALMKRALLAAQTITPPAPMEMNATNLMKDAAPDFVVGAEADDAFILGQTKFALSLLQNTAEENVNTLVSPYSVVQALGMTANGAAGDTKTEMEQT
ncbi:MAG: leucine-rich repeat protein, partial [Oscillospiraceae bacterium]|nr:leucine-rich repeat protein [Oscillospiraceae bacterium]